MFVPPDLPTYVSLPLSRYGVPYRLARERDPAVNPYRRFAGHHDSHPPLQEREGALDGIAKCDPRDVVLRRFAYLPSIFAEQEWCEFHK